MHHPAPPSRRAFSLLLLAAVLAYLGTVAAADPPTLVATFKGHNDVVYSVAFSPDGKLLATGSFDNTVKLWDAATAKELKTYAGPAGHQKQVLTVAFSPDGHLLASGGADNTCKVWDVPSTSPLRTLAASDAVNALTLSPDGTKLATAGKDGLVKLWNVADFKPLFELKGHTGPALSVGFSPNGQILVSSGADRTVRFWNVVNGQSAGVVGAHTAAASAAVMSPNNVAAYSAGEDGLLKFIGLPIPPTRTLPAHADAVTALALSPDGNTVFSAGADKLVRIALATTTKEVRPLTGAPAAVTALAVNGNAATVAAGTADSHLLLWNAADGKPLAQKLAHSGGVTGVSFHPQNTQLLTAGGDGLLKVWALPILPTRALPHADAVLAMAATPDGKRLFTGGADKVLRSWDLAKAAVEKQFPTTGPVTAVAVSPNGQLLVSGGADGLVRFWNQAMGKEVEALGAHGGKVTSLAVSPSGTLLLSASEDNTVKLWQLPVVAPKALVHPDAVTSAALSPDGTKLLTGGNDKQGHVWNLTTGTKERMLPGAALPVTAVAWSADGKTLATGSADKSLTLWSAADGKQAHKIALPAAVQTIALSPDGKHVAAGLADASIRVYDTAPRKAKEKEKEVRILPGGKGAVTALLYSPKGDQVLFARADSELQTWTSAGVTPVALGKFGPITALAQTKDGTRHAAASGKVVKVWSAAAGKEIATITTPAEVRGVAFSPDGNRLIVGGADNRARLYGVDGKLLEFFATDGPVRTVAYLPDGKRLVTAGDDKLARIWTPALLWERQHAGPVQQALFSPKGDQVISAGADKMIRLWNTADGKELKTIAAHDGPVAAISVSADGTRLASAGESVKVWSLVPPKAGTKDDGKPLAVFPLSGPAQGVALTPNGLRVAAGSGDKEPVVRVFDVALGREILAIPEHKGAIHALAFQADNRTLLSAGADKAARIADVGVLAVLDAHKGGAIGVQYHANGTQALSAGKDNTIKLWDLAKGAVLKTFGDGKTGVYAFTFNRDHTQVGAALGNTVRVWNVADAKELPPLLHPAPVLSLSFSVDKTRIATGAADKQTRLWDAASGKELQFFAHADTVRAVVLHPNNKDVVSGAGKAVTVDSAAVGRVISVGGPVHALTLTPNGTHALTAGADKLVTFWNLANGNKDRTVAAGPAPLRAVAVSKNLALLATGGDDKTVRLFNFADGKELKSVQAPAPVRALAFSPNNLALAGACTDRSLVVWNTAYTPGQPLAETFLAALQSFAHGDGATDVVFAADNATLWSSGTDKTVRSWKVAADAPVRNFPHPNIVDVVAFHPTAPMLATGAHDGKVRFFDLVKGALIREINAHPTPNATMVYAIAFSPDGKQLASAGYDHIVKLWDVNKGVLVREFKTIPLRPSHAVAARMVGVLASPHREGALVAPCILLASLDKKAFDKGHEDSIFSLAFSPDGKQIASGSGGLERVIKVWNVADATLAHDFDNPKLKRRATTLPQSHPGWVYGLRWTPDGKRLVSVGDAPLNKGYLAVWDAAAGKLLYGEELPLGVFYAVAPAPDGKLLAIGAGPRGRPTPEFNSAYLIKMPGGGK